MAGKNKLELTWIGKSKREKLEPRVLIEDKGMGYSGKFLVQGADAHDNILIKGDNLLALKSLEATHSGIVKCIYIDPPYNIRAATPYYEDGLETSEWLSLMKDRLSLLKRLLSPEGVIFVQIDDRELAYLTILMDELFGRQNRVNIISVKMSEATGVKMTHARRRLPKTKEFILFYTNGNSVDINPVQVPLSEWNNEYKEILLNIDNETLSEVKEIIYQEKGCDADIATLNQLIKDCKITSLSKYFSEKNITKDQEKDDFKWANAWRIVQAVGAGSIKDRALAVRQEGCDLSAVISSRGKLSVFKTNFDSSSRDPRIRLLFADKYLTYNPGDFWTDIKTAGGVADEGGVKFPKGKKPEALLQRLISMVTKPGDIVLDSFAGSGTTGAVAHKMGRRWIMVELGEHAESHIVPRLKKVIDGQDPSGITENVGWQGGGGYRYFRLAPSLLQKDQWGQHVISKDYKPEMLAEAVCKLMGFTYAPSQNHFWQHGHSTENDFIYVTTQRLTYDALRKLSHEVGERRTLLVCCRAHDENTFDNLTVRKIPHAVMAKCEWGRDDYSLNIQEASAEPITEGDLDEDDTVEAAE
ncbi:site-specific DNA-methyltransferase [Roseovarius nubinhibens]|nr:site-specific DNA-methyltransferase [Roseovarius nubinhibens]